MNSTNIVSDTFRLNAYRVLRIPISASASDIYTAAARMRQAEPGVFKTSQIDIPQLGVVSRKDADISAAIARLATPAQRLADRLFWFCELPSPANAHRVSTAMDPSGHDAILLDVFDAMQGGLDEAGLGAWVKTLRDWHTVTSDDDYWFLTLCHEEQGNFEPLANALDVAALRADAVRLAAEPLILAGRAAFLAEDKETVSRVLAALSALMDTGKWASAAMEQISTTTGTTGTTGTTSAAGATGATKTTSAEPRGAKVVSLEAYGAKQENASSSADARHAQRPTTAEETRLEVDPSIHRYVDVFRFAR